MFQFFIETPVGNPVTINAPSYTTIKELVIKQRTKILERYARAPMTVLNNRQLDKLIKGFHVPISSNWGEYYSRVKHVSDRHAAVCGIVTPNKVTQPTNDPFFSSAGIYELTVSVEYPWNESDAYSDIQAVRWLYHESTSTTMPVYNRQHIPDFSDLGIWVIGIDVALLMVQYHKWRYANTGTDSVDRFIASVVLPGMIDSHFGIMLLNRLRLLTEGKIPSLSPNLHQMAFPSIDKAIDTILKYYITSLEHKSNFKYHQILRSLPGFIEPTFWDIAKIPNASYSNLSNWARDIARFPLVGWLLRFMHETHNSNNREFTNDCKIRMRALKQTNYLRTGVGNQYERIQRWVNYTIENQL